MKIIKIDRLPIVGDIIEIIPLNMYSKTMKNTLRKDLAEKRFLVKKIYYEPSCFEKNNHVMIGVEVSNEGNLYNLFFDEFILI